MQEQHTRGNRLASKRLAANTRVRVGRSTLGHTRAVCKGCVKRGALPSYEVLPTTGSGLLPRRLLLSALETRHVQVPCPVGACRGLAHGEQGATGAFTRPRAAPS